MVDSSDFMLNPRLQGPSDRAMRQAGVLVGVADGPNGAEIILTKRSSKLEHHPGQVAFPGGKAEVRDADITATALREAQEEVGLHPDLVQVLGVLPSHSTATGFHITPTLAYIRPGFRPVPQDSEVEEVFSVPLRHLGDLAKYRLDSSEWRGGTWTYYAVPWGPYYIWGATARILQGLAARLQG
ncbi:MAG: CoA pyrophosphatase [Gemmobacter sp.]|nr:CoA pyrophosphatase [Gemmobacter sp.]